jgi:hypothetical protein
MAILDMFRACSANWDKFPELTTKSIEAFIENLLKLVSRTEYKKQIHSIHEFSDPNNDLENLLYKKFIMYGSDKADIHNYYIFYAHILQKLGVDRDLHVLEIGIGTNNPRLISSMGKDGKPGASLRAFRDVLKNSRITGADIDRHILFEEERIRTLYVDQLNPDSFSELGKDMYDIIIDDGLHSIGANSNTLLFALNHIRPYGWIVIEDINPSEVCELWGILDFFVKQDPRFCTFLVRAKSSYMYAVERIV